MFERQATLSLFPTPVWVFDLPPTAASAVNRGVLDWLDRTARYDPTSRGDLSQQTDHDFHENPEFLRLAPFVSAAVASVAEGLGVRAEPPEITGCWVNVAKAGSRHHEHSHPNNWLSGVYYIATPEGADSITFYDPRPQAHVMSLPVARRSVFTGAVMTVTAQAGRLILFPSWLRHGVEPNRSQQDRVSLALNFMFPDFGERFARPMWAPKIRTAPEPDLEPGSEPEPA